MENILLVTIIALLVMVCIAIFFMVFVAYRFLKLKESSYEVKNAPETTPDTTLGPPSNMPKASAPQRSVDLLKAMRLHYGENPYCVDHPDIASQGQCAVSGEHYCELCLTKQEEIRLAKKYLDYYLDSEWTQIAMLSHQTLSQQDVERIVAIKKQFWHGRQQALLVQGHFKIDVGRDEIEHFTVIRVPSDYVEFAKRELSFIL